MKKVLSLSESSVRAVFLDGKRTFADEQRACNFRHDSLVLDTNIVACIILFFVFIFVIPFLFAICINTFSKYCVGITNGNSQLQNKNGLRNVSILCNKTVVSASDGLQVRTGGGGGG
jgi:hypothetical protein